MITTEMYLGSTLVVRMNEPQPIPFSKGDYVDLNDSKCYEIVDTYWSIPAGNFSSISRKISLKNLVS